MVISFLLSDNYSRVHLREVTAEESSYINASFVGVRSPNKQKVVIKDLKLFAWKCESSLYIQVVYI